MASNTGFRIVDQRGWQAGLPNLLRRELSEWFTVRKLLFQYVLWGAIINGMLGLVLVTMKSQENPPGAELMGVGVEVFAGIATMATAVAAIIISQDAIVGERNSGSAAWVLSKPVSRPAFVLAKFLGNFTGLLTTAVILQSFAAYFEVAILSGQSLPPGRFAVGGILVVLHFLFYMTLTLMLGTFFTKRGAVLGIPMVILFGHQFPMGFAPWLGRVMPWSLPRWITSFILNGQLDVLPVLLTVVWCTAFVAVGIWRFNSEDL